MAAICVQNMPLQATSFIGRELELAELKRLMASTRLLTLTGAGGCGKTRLGLEAAARMTCDFPDGVWLAELAGLTEPALVPQAVATALGLRESGRGPVTTLLAEFLTQKELLLVLDNCEHLIEACAALADALLRTCPGLRVLATSREPLALPWETVYTVPTLPPDSDGVALFEARARSFQPDFSPTPAVHEICRRLDGMPLAIELAAARVRMLSPEQITERLDDSLRLLTGGSRILPPRQQTLRGAVDWSYQLLSAPEQALFRRLSVFAGGFTLDALEAVAGTGADTLDLLTQLVDKSLVIAAAAPRYRMLEPLRQYAQARLRDEGEEAAARDAHLAYFTNLCHQAREALMRADQGAWLTRLDAEHDNLRLALEWSLEHGPRAGLALAASIGRFWVLRGHLSEGRRWLDLLLAKVPEPVVERAMGLLTSANLGETNKGHLLAESCQLFEACGDEWGLAWASVEWGGWLASRGERARALEQLTLCRTLFTKLGDDLGLASISDIQPDAETGEVFPVMAERLRLLRQAGDTFSVIRTLIALSGEDFYARDYTRAAGRLDEAIALAQQIGDRQGLAAAQASLGEIAHRTGDLARARELYEAAHRAFETFGDRVRLAETKVWLGRLATDMHEPERALRLLTGALAVMRELGAPWQVQTTLVFLALAHLETGAFKEARCCVEEANAMARKLDDGGQLAWSLRVLGMIAGRQGHYDEALRHQRESLSVDVARSDLAPGLALGVLMTGVWLIHSGEAERGLKLVAAADAIHPLNSALDPLERPYLQPALDLATDKLGPDGFAKTWAAGHDLDRKAAVAEALATPEKGKPGGLTARELEIAKLVAEGLPDKEIAARLFISVRTVDTHLRNIFNKTGVESRTALAAWAIRNDIG